jgi:hypothetical protein
MTSLLAVLSVIPGFLLFLLSVMFLLGFVRVLLSSQQMMFEFMLIGLFIGFLWWLYMQLPGFLRRWLSKLFGTGERNGHEH